jgi:hypothetical protein
MVFDKLIQAGFAVRCDKVHIAKQEVPYLGFLVNKQGTIPQREKTAAIVDLSFTDLLTGGSAAAARYAGMIGFYHRFIPNLHSILAPFHACKAKNAPINEIMNTLQFQAAFEYSKKALAEVTALARPDFDKDFYIDVDAASSTGIGAVLSQRDDPNDEESHRPLAFWSRRFCSEERRYGVRDQECLGLVDSLATWRHMVHGSRIIVRTDHKSLEWLLRTTHKEGTRVSGWALKVQPFDVTIQWIPGSQNKVADCFSRAPVDYAIKTESTQRADIDDRVQEALDIATAYRNQTASLYFTSSDCPSRALGHSSAARRRRAHDTELEEIYNSRPTSKAWHEAKLSMEETDNLIDKLLSDDISPDDRTSYLSSPPLFDHGGEKTGGTGLPTATVPTNVFSIFGSVCNILEPVNDVADCCVVNSPAVSHKSTRVAAVLLRLGEDGLQVLTQQQGASLSVPSIVPDGSRHNYRTQMATHLALSLQDSTLSDCVLNYCTVSLKRRDARSTCTHYLIGQCGENTDFVLPRSLVHYKFMDITTSLLRQLSTDIEPSDVTVLLQLSNIARGSDSYLPARHRVRSLMSDILSTPVSVLNAEEEVALPNVIDNRYGPALCSTRSELHLVGQLLEQRLRDNPGMSIAVDLEGYRLGTMGATCLIQLAVDAAATGDRPLIYVIDALLCGPFLRGNCALRNILQDESIIKVLHCCYGDAAAFFVEYNISLKGVFDTSVADSLLMGRKHNIARRLDKVAIDYLGSDAVEMQYKGVIEHSPDLWYRRPLTMKLFTYAYEDVVPCNRLYIALRTQLCQHNLYELCLCLSQHRAPPIALPITHSQYVSPAKLVVALVDKMGNALCLRSSSRRWFLPWAKTVTDLDPKQQARDAWERFMGPPQGLLKNVMSNRLRKGVRVGCYSVHLGVVNSLTACVQAIDKGRALTSGDPVRDFAIHPMYTPRFGVGCLPEQHLLFRYLYSEARRTATQVSNVLEPPHVSANLEVGASGYVKLSLSSCLPLADVRKADTLKADRGACILHDDKHVYVLQSPKGELSFPSLIASKEPDVFSAAVKAFDIYAGVSLRKYNNPRVQGVVCMPNTSDAINAAFDKASSIGVFGNTEFFSCRLEDGAMSRYEASFHSSRRPMAGFELTPDLSKRHPHFGIVSIRDSSPVTNFAKFDKDALAAVSQLLDAPPVSQHSGGPDIESPTADTCLASQHSGERKVEDEEEDALVTAATAINLVRLLRDFDGASEAFTTHGDCSEDPTEMPTKKKKGAKGAAQLGHEAISIDEVREEQSKHPATSELVKYLQLGIVPHDCQYISQFKLVDDLLQTTALHPAGPDRIVLPPRFRKAAFALYHDVPGHFGISKCLPLLLRRYTWGTSQFMRAEFSKYIGLCRPCIRTKLPTHKAGDYRMGTTGNHPGDIWSTDYFAVGVEYDGYKGTQDFACHFSRTIVSEPTKGVPDSATYGKILINSIIRRFGVPSEIRSDRGSSLISKAVRRLYRKFKILMTVGTAHHHNIVALVERWHRTLKQLLLSQKAAGLDNNWPARIPLLELAYNNTINPTIKVEPFLVDHLRHARLPSDAMSRACKWSGTKDARDWVQEELNNVSVMYDAVTQAIRLKGVSAKRRYDLRRNVCQEFKPGDSVYVIKGAVIDGIHPKSDIPTFGPFVVEKRLAHNRYRLSGFNTRRMHNEFDVSRLILDPPPAPEEGWMMADAEHGGTWAVKAVTGKRTSTNKKTGESFVEYKIRWVGFDKTYDRWRRRDQLDSIMSLINLYDGVEEIGEPVVPRATDLPTPPPAPEAVDRRRFQRHRPDLPDTPQLDAGDSSPSDSLKNPPSPEPALTPNDLTDRFPVHSRVRVYYARENKAWTGTVVKSLVTKPRKVGFQPDRRITVVYDDPAYGGELFEHDLSQSDVTLLEPPLSAPDSAHTTRRSQRLCGVTPPQYVFTTTSADHDLSWLEP